MKELRDTVRSMVRDMLQTQTLECTVKSVDAEKGICTCTTLRSQLDIENVRLSAVPGELGVIYKPAVGSRVIICMIENIDTRYQVIQFSEIDEVIFHNGENGGLIKIEELKKEIDKLNSYVDAIGTVLQSWTVAPTDGGLALQAAAKIALAGKKTADLSNVTNDKIKH